MSNQPIIIIGGEGMWSLEQYNELHYQIVEWSLARGITIENGATIKAQATKLIEEAKEIIEACDEGDMDKLIDAMGDCDVVLNQINRLSGIPRLEALERAYNEIKDRTGVMRCGVFVKQADLDLVGDYDWVAFEKCTDAGMVKDLIYKAKAWNKNGRNK